MIDNSNVLLILALAGIPFFIAGLIGNVLVIRIVHKTRDMHTTTNYLLANLALSDVITILLSWPSMLISIANSEFEQFICKFSVVSILPISVSSFTLTVLAVERYHALLKPFRTGLRLKEDNIKQAIAVIWISSVAICLPSFFLSEWNENDSYCVPNKVYSVIIIPIILAYIPMIVFLYCYGSLIEGLYFSHAICTENTSEDRNSEKKRLVITFILATAGFVIGYGPTCIFHTVTMLGGEEQKGFKLSTESAVVQSIFFCSLCLNPILYAFRSTNFREGFKRIIICRESPPQIDMEMS